MKIRQLKNKLEDFRMWLIEKLAGNSTVVINAHFINGGMVISGDSRCLISNTTIEVFSDQAVALSDVGYGQ